QPSCWRWRIAENTHLAVHASRRSCGGDVHARGRTGPCADDRVVAPGDAGAPSLARGFPPWIRMESDVETGLEAVWGTSPNTLFAVGVSGTIQHFDGERWVRQESGVTSALRDVWGTSSDNVWAVGGLGALMHYDGTAWRL